MKLANIIFTLSASTLLTTAAFADTEKNWSLIGVVSFETTIVNTSDQPQHLIVKSNPYLIIGGDVFVTPNDVAVECDGGVRKSLFTLKPGVTATCLVKPHGNATITIIQDERNWGAEGSYQFTSD